VRGRVMNDRSKRLGGIRVTRRRGLAMIIPNRGLVDTIGSGCLMAGSYDAIVVGGGL